MVGGNEASGSNRNTDENLHELTVHGTPQFPMSVHFTHIAAGSGQVLYAHWHEELEFLFFVKGQARVQVGKDEFIIREKEIAVIPPNTFHLADRAGKLPVEFYAILIHFSFLSSMENDYIQRHYVLPLFFGGITVPVHITTATDAEMGIFPVLLQIVRVYSRKEQGYELYIKAKLFEILHILIKCNALMPSIAPSLRSVPHSEKSKVNFVDNKTAFNWVKRYLYYIQQNYSEHISLGDMARQVNLSEGHFCRLVKKSFGVSPVEFLNNYRASRAVYLIETTDQSLSSISDMTGFSNVNRFSAIFKKIFHCTPISYRREIKGIIKE
jgi:AraC-like DNA-binding protein/mannose-6-phosphate isomerase-like protein (cupin superfamily)